MVQIRLPVIPRGSGGGGRGEGNNKISVSTDKTKVSVTVAQLFFIMGCKLRYLLGGLFWCCLFGWYILFNGV